MIFTFLPCLLLIHTASSFSALQEWVEHRSNARPKVMFMAGKLSQYYDLTSSKWVQSMEETTEGSWSSILKFCQKNYPNLDVTNVRKSDTASVKVQWCNYNNPSKCRKFASRVPWYCLERSRTASPGTASPSLQPTSVTDMMCLSMEISFDVCISITEVTMHCKQRCDAQNLSFQSLNPKDSCNDSRSNMSLRAADIKCCPSTGGYNRGDLFPSHETQPPEGGNIGDIFGVIDTSESTNPFLPKAPPNITKLPDEWCGLEDVEKGTDDINAAIKQALREMYNQTKGKDVDPYNEVVKNGTRAVIKLYTGHFECLMTTLVNTTMTVQSLWDKTKERFPERAEKIRDYVEGSMQEVTLKRGEVEQGFKELVMEYTHLTNKYRGLVTIAQRLKSEIDKVQVALEMIINKKQPECQECNENEIKDSTDSPIPPFIRPDRPSKTEPTIVDTQKPIMTSGIVIVVGAVCCCIIIPAFLFFVYIVQKTLKKKKKFPSSDTLSNEQYVAILQKNGFENPTCRLPRKYLDDHD